jgi:hypothetical protein
LKRIHEQAQRDKDATFLERSFLRNFYNYAKEAVAGAIGGGRDSPQFPVEVANTVCPIFKRTLQIVISYSKIKLNLLTKTSIES